MNAKKLKTIGRWCLALSIIALIVWGGRSCKAYQNRERKAKKQAKVEQLLHDKFVYLDMNGVYHIDHGCYKLNDAFWNDDDEKVRHNYSAQYISRSTIEDWYQFAATHQLCSECFTPALIRDLDSVRTVNIYPDGAAGLFDFH